MHRSMLFLISISQIASNNLKFLNKIRYILPSGMFLLEMDDELRHDVLVMTKEKWEAGHSVPGNEKLDDVILFEVFNALFVIRSD